ncbi:MAG: UvrD-helicase domain-containing protein [Turneriella sp.]
MAEHRQNSSAAGLVASGRHVFIEASAGSGKTTRLVEILSEIICSGAAEIGQTLCVTFTEKAASELKARVYAKLQSVNSPAALNALAHFTENQIGTIHEFCLRQLSESPRANIASSAAANAKEEEIFEEAREWVYRTVWPEFDTTKLAQLLDECRFGSGGRERTFDTDLRQKALFCFASPGAVLWPAAHSGQKITTGAQFKSYTLQRIVAKMREIVSQRNLMTFAGMITGFADALGDADFAQKTRSRFRFALIDEFQDTDSVQWQIFRTLFLSPAAEENAARLIVVGDPKQAIYKFRGADVFVYLQARSELTAAGALTEVLGTNYRSAPELLEVQNAIFSVPEIASIWNDLQVDYSAPLPGNKTQSTGDAFTGAELYYTAKYAKSNEEKFARLAAARIAEIRDAHPDWTIAVIAYRHASLVTMAAVLQEFRIPYAYYKQKPDFRSLEVEHLRILLEALTLPHDEGYALAASTLFLKGHGDAAAYYLRLSHFAAQGRILNLLQQVAAHHTPLHLLLEHYPDAARFHSWRTLFQILLGLCGKTIFDLASLRSALFDLCTEPNSDELTGDMLSGKGAVTLLTVQSSKGLDWNAVVVADGIHDKRWNNFAFFHNREKQAVVAADVTQFDESSEKLMTSKTESQLTQLNLLYVALTRAKHKLIALVTPNYASVPAGPVARFLHSWIANGLAKSCGATIVDFDARDAAAGLPQKTTAVPPVPVIRHGDIPLRVAQRTSFTALMSAADTGKSPGSAGEDTAFADDILPRGALTGQLLHDILERCNFSAFAGQAQSTLDRMHAETENAVQQLFDLAPERARSVASRILEIVQACATASLPLSAAQNAAKTVALAELGADNLWREMPFWSTQKIHRVLAADGQNSPVRRTMHGYMDLVFSADGKNYYILDYKSNSLADIEPENISEYTQSHYGLQAEIYAEALSAYLKACYPVSGARVAGCYFVYLRYLKPGESVGVHFMDFYGR